MWLSFLALSCALEGFVKSFVDASKFGTVSSGTPEDWTGGLAMMGSSTHSTSAILLHFPMPYVTQRVRVKHASMYCVEHDPITFLGTANLAPITVDWLGSNPHVVPSWSSVFETDGHLGSTVANAVKVHDH